MIKSNMVLFLHLGLFNLFFTSFEYLQKNKLIKAILLKFLYKFCRLVYGFFFCIASHIVIALPTIAIAIVLALLRS